MGLIEEVAQHPWAALAIGAWILWMVHIVAAAVKECIATLATGKRAPQPDWRALKATEFGLPSRPRRRRARSNRRDGEGTGLDADRS